MLVSLTYSAPDRVRKHILATCYKGHAADPSLPKGILATSQRMIDARPS